jgi:putative ABC transport system ATP-binding protein
MSTPTRGRIESIISIARRRPVDKRRAGACLLQENAAFWAIKYHPILHILDIYSRRQKGDCVLSSIITIRDLSKVYRIGREKILALSSINLELKKAEICCILGPSGSGKSTLLNQLAGLEKPTRGSVHIGKTNISRLTEDQLAGFRQKNIGFVFQSYNLLPTMTALENVSMPLLFRGVSRSVRDREASAMLRQVGLGDRMRHRPSEMSGGQQQRVGIARAFVARPRIVFADEPTGNLDSRTTLDVMRLLIEMSHQHGITFVLVTHNQELALYADRIISIRDGEVVDDLRNEHPAYLDEHKEPAVAPGDGDPALSSCRTPDPPQEEPGPEDPSPPSAPTTDNHKE